jgi:hypothetical protein
MPATWHAINAEHGSVTVDNVLLFTARGVPPASVVEGLKKQLGDLGKANPRGAGYIHVIEVVPGRGIPESGAREAFVDLIKIAAPSTKAAMVVIQGSGFGAATARITASAIVLAAGGGHPIKIHKSLGEGLPWFEGVMRKAGASLPAAGTLVDAGNELLRRIEVRGSAMTSAATKESPVSGPATSKASGEARGPAVTSPATPKGSGDTKESALPTPREK